MTRQQIRKRATRARRRSAAARVVRSITLVCLLLVASAPAGADAMSKLTPPARRALDGLSADQTISVIVRLADQAAPHVADASGMQLVPALRRHAAASQASIRQWLRARGVKAATSFWIFNGLAVTASPAVVRELAQRPDVARVSLDEARLAPYRLGLETQAGPPGANLITLRASEAWQRGITGKGIVVAVLDSGADVSHPELRPRWRGGANSWFDPYGDFTEAPIDIDGHGTQTLGVIVGGEENGSPIGVAPGAQWIAARIFDTRGRASVSAIHAALQWVLDPDGDPATDDAPDIVNSSWSLANPGCDPEFTEDLRALRAAGILPVFAAGLRGSVSPANTPEAFGVGALSDFDSISFDSPRGPSACDGVPVYPLVVAPGENIRTTDRFGYYTTTGGTSFAAAHVSGALALLLEADPTLTPDEQAALLTETAVDLGPPGPDDTFGYGRIDVAAALDRLIGPDPARQAAQQSAVRVGLSLAAGAAVIGIIAFAMQRRRRSRPA
jgi:subtilisin family serine protease